MSGIRDFNTRSGKTNKFGLLQDLHQEDKDENSDEMNVDPEPAPGPHQDAIDLHKYREPKKLAEDDEDEDDGGRESQSRPLPDSQAGAEVHP